MMQRNLKFGTTIVTEVMVEIRQITVIGSGTMGRGIAWLALDAGYEVFLTDVEEDRLDEAKDAIETLFTRAVEKGKIDSAHARESLARLSSTSDLESACRQANLIIEAVPENLELKKELFSQADLYCDVDTILASNTSSLSISALAGSVEKRDLFVGLHFFNPPHRMKLVEIVAGNRTSQETIDAVADVARKMGKETIVVRDTPGFATSRLGVAMGLEAIRMLEEGVASAEDIDRAMELGYNHPMGPLRVTDLVGLDVRLSIAEYLASTLGPRFEPPALLRRMVEEGRVGRKSGRGFFEWPE
ncbi:MAG: 3-hydroxyacyl-CoA dehydrogenase family protein [Thermoanaerobaculia bacterium]